MKFRIWTILWVFALFASAMATFSHDPVLGIGLTFVILYCWGIVFEAKKRQRNITVVEVLIVLALLSVLCALLLPAAMRSYEGERSSQCRNKLSQIAQVLLEYKNQNGTLPPSSVTNARSEPQCSWRVAILTAIGHSEVFRQYDMSKPWNHSANSAARNTIIPSYICRNDFTPTNALGETTSYFAVTGSDTAWSAMEGSDKSFSDNPSQTILLMEQLERGVPWCEPKDLSFDEALKLLTLPTTSTQPIHLSCGEYKFFYKPRPQLGRGFNVAFADGSTRYIPVPISKELAKSLLTANGGETISTADLDNFWHDQLDFSKIYAFCIFVLLSLLPITKLRHNKP